MPMWAMMEAIQLIQRCRFHKEKNIKAYLPKKHHKVLSLKLKAAWGMTAYAEAKKELAKVHDWLATINIAAAKSLEEGFEQTLTINKLNLSPQLRKVFASTNMIESAFSLTEDLCRNVKRWRDVNMTWRWAGTVLQEAEKRFHRIHGSLLSGYKSNNNNWLENSSFSLCGNVSVSTLSIGTFSKSVMLRICRISVKLRLSLSSFLMMATRT